MSTFVLPGRNRFHRISEHHSVILQYSSWCISTSQRVRYTGRVCRGSKVRSELSQWTWRLIWDRAWGSGLQGKQSCKGRLDLV